MKIKTFLIILLVFFLPAAVFADTLLKGSVSVIPKNFLGVWRVTSKLVETNAPVTFKEKGLDLWNISRTNDVLYLSNPFSGASAQVEVNKSDNQNVVFTKTGKYNNKILVDTVSITISGDSFTGFDELEMKTVSDVDGKIMKTERAKYQVKGEKLSE